jgi:hypothetical protein
MDAIVDLAVVGWGFSERRASAALHLPWTPIPLISFWME